MTRVPLLLVLLSALLAPGSVYAQDDDDLLGGLGGDEEESTQEDAVPIEDTIDDEELDVDAPLDEMVEEESAAPAEGESEEDKKKADEEAKKKAAEAAAKKKEEEAKKAAQADPSSLDRVKAVQRKPVLKALRVEATPQYGVSVNDPYYTHMSVGGSVVFYPHDSFGVGVSGRYYFAHLPGNAQRVVRIGQTAVPAVFDFPEASGSVDLFWIPLYGKIAIMNDLIIPFDFYAVAGLGFVTAGPNMRPSFKAGLGQRLMIGEWLAIRLEVSDTVYNDTHVVAAQTRSDIQNYVMFEAGVSFFVPPSFEYTRF